MVHGVINIRKEKGFTSHDVVAKLRGIIGQKKIGHTGTLDPDATGVLPVCLGKATKLCDMLTDKDKTYETVLLLGKATDTQDISGTVLSEKAMDGIDNDAVERCIGEFVGEYLQVPPMYSALKVNGKKLYELARAGIEVERKARPVIIYEIRIKEISLPRVRMEVSCSKGTVLSEKAMDGIDNDAVERCIGEFVGEYLQVPPMYSALKVNGKKLYELARAGIEVERKARPVIIYEIRIKEISLPRVRMEVSCSKGTYIRTLCHDIGEKLGCGGCMEELTRTKVSRFTLEDSYTLEEVRQKKEAGLLSEILVPIDEMFGQYEAVTLKRPYEALVCNGNMFFEKHINESKDLIDGEYVRVYSNSGQFIAIYAYQQKQKMFKIVKMFFDKNE